MPPDEGRPWRLALPWLVLPVTLVAAYAVLIGPIFQPRYFSFVAPAGALLDRRRADPISWRSSPSSAGVAMLVAIAPAYASQRVAYAKAGTDWSTASEVIAELALSAGRCGVLHSRVSLPRWHHVGWTARRISYGYPGPFETLDDLTSPARPEPRPRLTRRRERTHRGFARRLSGATPSSGSFTAVNYPGSLVDHDRRPPGT